MTIQANPFGLSDPEMVTRIQHEAQAPVAGGGITLAAYRHFSTLGFSRLRRHHRFSALDDIEKRETAYLAAGLFIKAILEGQYQPRPDKPSVAFFWTICYCRGVDALRKFRLNTGETPPQGESGPSLSAFARRYSLDADPALGTTVATDDHFVAYMDRELIWKAIRQNLGDSCHRILYASLEEGQKNDDAWQELGFANKDSFKSRKTKCLAELKNYLRPYFLI